jgi:hypothetical protein
MYRHQYLLNAPYKPAVWEYLPFSCELK